MSGNKMILIAEEGEASGSETSETLESLGYNVAGVAKTGTEVIEMAEVFLPDLVLMDIQLEGKIDGIMAASYITSMFKIPVLFVSGEENDEIFEKAAKSFPAGFIIKPFTANDIYSNVEIVLKTTQLKRKQAKIKYELPAVLLYKSMAELDAYFLLDLKGKILFLNPYAEHLINKDITEVAMNSINDYLVFYDIKSGEPISDTFNKAVRERTFYGNQTRIAVKLASESFRPVVVTFYAVKNTCDQPIGTLFKMHLKSKSEV